MFSNLIGPSIAAWKTCNARAVFGWELDLAIVVVYKSD